MKIVHFATALVLLSFHGAAHAQNVAPQVLPFDAPQTMRTMEAVCAGVGSESRADPRWASYPLKIEIAGEQGQFLGDADVSVNKGAEALVSVRCGGPWVLLKIEPGAYSVTAAVGGATATSRVTVGGAGQARVVLRFPGQGGAVSKEYVPKL